MSAVRRVLRAVVVAGGVALTVVLIVGRSGDVGMAAGGLSFTDITVGVGVGDPAPGGHGIFFSDADGNGFPDLYITMNIGPPLADRFFVNAGGSFAELAAARGISDVDFGSHGGVWADLDNDGDYDLVNGTTYRGDAIEGEPNDVYRNDGNASFSDVTPAAIRARAEGTRQVLAFDMERDGDLDLFTVSGWQGSGDPAGERNEVYRNDGGFQLAPITSGAPQPARARPTLYNAPAGQGATDTDYDGDGDIDVIAGNRDGTLNVLRNDGDLDLMFSGDGVVYLNDGTGAFTTGPPVPVGGIDDPRAIGFADIDNDGDLDVAISSKQSRNWILRNDLQMGNWLKVKLLSPTGQAGAFGAKARIFAAGQGAAGPPLALREARSGDGYLSQSDQVLHFGLGQRSSVDLVVTFLDGTRRTVTGVAANQLITVDGSSAPSPGPPAPTPPPPAPPPPTPPPTPPACSFSLLPTQFSIGAAGGDTQIGVTADPDCAWSAVSQATWITVTNGASGVGPGSVGLRVAQSVEQASRTGSVQIAGLVLVVVQAGSMPAGLDLNADGSGDVVRYDPVSGAWTGELGDSLGGFRRISGIWRPGWDIHAGSFDDDGFSDVLLYNPALGEWVKAFNDGMGGFRLLSSFIEAGLIVDVADLDDDSLSDIVLYDPTTGRSATGRSLPSGGFDFVRGVWPIGWEAHLADLNDDGRDDVFLYDPAFGQWYQLISDGRGGFTYAGTSVPTTQPPPPGSTQFGPSGAIVMTCLPFFGPAET